MEDMQNLAVLRRTLYEIGYPYHDISDQYLSKMLYERENLFVNLILWIISNINDEIGEYLSKSKKLMTDITETLHDLQFTKEEDKHKFVLGELPKDQQFNVWLKILNTVKDVLVQQGSLEEDAVNIDDLVFKKNQKRHLFSVISMEAGSIPSSQEIDLLLQDAKAKLQSLESLRAEETTMEMTFGKVKNSSDMETITTSVLNNVEDCKASVAGYVKKLRVNKSDSNRLPLIDEETTSNIKQLIYYIPSASSSLLHFNGCKNVEESGDM